MAEETVPVEKKVVNPYECYKDKVGEPGKEKITLRPVVEKEGKKEYIPVETSVNGCHETHVCFD